MARGWDWLRDYLYHELQRESTTENWDGAQLHSAVSIEGCMRLRYRKNNNGNALEITADGEGGYSVRCSMDAATEAYMSATMGGQWKVHAPGGGEWAGRVEEGGKHFRYDTRDEKEVKRFVVGFLKMQSMYRTLATESPSLREDPLTLEAWAPETDGFLRVLPCNHMLKPSSIAEAWLRRGSCPLCRGEVFSVKGSSHSSPWGQGHEF